MTTIKVKTRSRPILPKESKYKESNKTRQQTNNRQANATDKTKQTKTSQQWIR
jgi:hypothetical protein